MHKSQNTMNCELQENNTISVAAYLSNYNPSTTEPIGHERQSEYDGYTGNISQSPLQHQETNMHFQPYNHECNNYNRTEYGLPPAHFLNNQPTFSQQEPNASHRPGSYAVEEAFSSDYIMDGKLYDILDLDSHKMCNHHNTFIPHHQQEINHELFLPNQPNNQQLSTSVIEPEYFVHQPQKGHQQQQDANLFNNDANQVIPSPSEFPPVSGEQFHTSFEAPTSLLPTSVPKGKSASQISTNVRRAKTYKCTACNKWFPSPSHLKKHYSSNLHKNVVKTSGQTDPAAVLVSHHIPFQQDKENIHRGSNNGQELTSPPPPQSQGPEYSSQYVPPLEFQVIEGFPQTQEFQYCAPAMHSTMRSSANDPTNHSVLVSQSEEILNLLNNTEISQVVNDYNSTLFPSYNTSVPHAVPNHLLMEGATTYQGDAASDYSQYTTETTFQNNHMSPASVASIPQSPASSSISSTGNGTSIPNMETMCACPLCDKVFNKPCYLKQHNKTFHSGAQFKCTKCGKRFASKDRRDIHMQKHDGVKPFNCEYDDCDRSFNHKADLQRHVFVHTGQLPHVCGNCSKAFARKDHMLKHMQTRGCKAK